MGSGVAQELEHGSGSGAGAEAGAGAGGALAACDCGRDCDCDRDCRFDCDCARGHRTFRGVCGEGRIGWRRSWSGGQDSEQGQT